MKNDHEEENKPETDPLRALDRRLRRDRLIRQIQEMGGIVGKLADEPSDIEIDFLERIVAWEAGPFTSHRDWLAQRGKEFVPPAELDDDSLARELWRLIEALALARVFLYQTDHLNDRELYERLWREVLPTECPDFARTEDDASHWDMADASGDDDEVWLRYYASKRDRRDWQRTFPERSLPPRAQLPQRRDHRLPVREES